jgi:thiol-disulfide isomerase/thioredoxin
MMKLKILFLFFVCLFVQCTQPPFTIFPKEALAQEVLVINGETTTMATVLKAHYGKTILIDVWASWCKDCVKGIPKIKALQAHPAAQDVVFLYLSMDKSPVAWRKAVTRHALQGAHYFMGNDWDNPFNSAIGLDWIPRYMLVGKDGTVKVFKAIKADDQAILNAIKEDK